MPHPAQTIALQPTRFSLREQSTFWLTRRHPRLNHDCLGSLAALAFASAGRHAACMIMMRTRNDDPAWTAAVPAGRRPTGRTKVRRPAGSSSNAPAIGDEAGRRAFIANVVGGEMSSADASRIQTDSGKTSDLDSLDETTWDTLVDTIIAKECTPFLGAGVGWPYLPTGKALAISLALENDYPLDDNTNLARVTQYIASLRRQPAYVKRKVCEKIGEAQGKAAQKLDGSIPSNFRRLAALELPIYVTTNYDDYMRRAIASLAGQSPRLEICRWNDRLREDLPKYSPEEPTPANPTVFHMHGHVSEQNSILVTEDDYIDFTVSLSVRNNKDPVVPHFVRRALGNSALLFVGYSLEDWNFRVLMRHLMKQMRLLHHEQYRSLSIQLSDTDMPAERRRRAEKFLEVYLENSSIDVHWGSAEPFLDELERRVAARRESGST